MRVLKPKRKTLSWTCLDCEEDGDDVHQGVKDFIQVTVLFDLIRCVFDDI